MTNSLNSANGSSQPPAKNNIERIRINPIRLFRIVISRWHWLLLSFIVCVSIGLVYARSAREEFMSMAILQYDSKSKEAKFSTSSMLAGEGAGSADYMAEVYRVKSTNVIEEALDSLRADFIFYRQSGLRKINLYPHRPFDADVLDYDVNNYGGGVYRLVKNGNAYDLKYKNKGINIDTTFKAIKEGTIVKVPGLSFRLGSNVFTEFDNITLTFIDYWKKKEMAEKMMIKEAERNLPVLRATFQSDNASFTKDFLASVISSYSLIDLETKRKSSEQTLTFINEQLSAFETLMRQSSSKLENIKSRYDLLDVGATSSQYMSSVSSLRERKLQLEIQGKNFDLVTDEIKNNKEVVANVIGWDGAPDPFLNNMLQDLNDAYRRRKQNLINYSPESIVIKNIDDEVRQLKGKIIENISLQKKKSEQAYSAYDKQLAELNKDLSRMPSAERDLIYTTSDVDVNKNIYTLLLNKKLETNIDKAGQTPSFITIEKPVVSVRTAPNEFLILVISAVLGLLLGVIVIFFRRAVNSRFIDVATVETSERISTLGVIRHSNAVKGTVASEMVNLQLHDDMFAEDINALRTNVLFKFNNQGHKVISVTSNGAGEGKTFLAVSLAAAIARLGKSVILVESDLRMPSFDRYFDQKSQDGLSNYLEHNLPLSKIIVSSPAPHLDYISAGSASRRPSELIHTSKFASALEELKQVYDYVIVDTAPAGIVSDSIPALTFSDITLFVLRWRYSLKTAVNAPRVLLNKYGLKHIGILVNDFKNDPLYASLEDSNNDFDDLYANAAYYSKDKIAKHKSIFKRARD